MRAHRHTFASYMADAFESPEQRALCIVAASVGRSEAVATGQTGQYDFTSVNTQRGAKRVVAARSRNGAHNGAAITVAVLLRILVERFQRLRLFRNDKHERVPSAVTFSSPLAAARAAILGVFRRKENRISRLLGRRCKDANAGY